MKSVLNSDLIVQNAVLIREKQEVHEKLHQLEVSLKKQVSLQPKCFGIHLSTTCSQRPAFIVLSPLKKASCL